MIKLKDILNEQEQFKAKSKETGRVVVYKSKENMDKAIKAGTAEPLDKKKMSGKADKVKGQDMFAKDIEKKKPMKSVRKDTIVRRHEDSKETLDDLRDEYQEAKEMGDTEEMKEISRMHSLYKNHSEAQKLTLDAIETQGDFNIDKVKEVVAGGPEKTSSEDLNVAVSEIDNLIDEIKSDDDYDMDEVRQLSKLKNRLKRVGEIQQDIKKSDRDEPKSDTSQDSGKNSPREDRLQASKIVRMSSHGNKIFFNKNPEKYAEQLEQTLLDIQDHADKMNDEDMSDEFYNNSEELAMQVNDIANSGEDMSFDDFKEARLFIKDYENALTKNKQSSPTASLGYRTGKNKAGGMYDGVIKLADLIKESKVWERKFGEPLPTLNSVMEKHQQNQLNESPVSVLKPPKKERNSIIYGYISLKSHYNQIKKTWKELKTLLDRIDYIAIDFDDRNESLNAVTNLPGWKDPFIREPMIKSFRNFTKFVNNPKNMREPERVQNAISKNIRQSALPKWIQLTNLYKQYLKFNNKKISSVFPATKGKKIGQKRIGDFGGFTLTEDVHKLFTNQSGFTQTNMRSAFEQMDWLMKGRYKKIMVRGPRD